VTSPVLLLIEDDIDHVDVILRAFRKAGVPAEVRVVRDGQEAIDSLGLDTASAGKPRALPRVVFLDLKMPRVDGWEVLRRLRSSPRTARLPVVIVSGSDRREDIERSYALGANSYLLKRFDPRGPGTYLAEAARYWIEMNRVPESELLAW
jgi:two-component system response regulator